MKLKKIFKKIYYKFDNWFYTLGQAKWWIYHRFHPDHKYYLIDLSKRHKKVKRWLDADEKMLYAMMSIMLDYVEKECGHGKDGFDYFADHRAYYQERMSNFNEDWTGHLNALNDLEEVYLYWTYSRSSLEREEEDLFNAFTATYKKEQFVQWMQLKDEMEALETEMLIKLIKIRGSMWT